MLVLENDHLVSYLLLLLVQVVSLFYLPKWVLTTLSK